MNDNFNENKKDKNLSSENTVSENENSTSEYEVSFDSRTGDYSYKGGESSYFTEEPISYASERTENTVDGEKPEKKKKKKKSAIVCITAICVSLAIIIGSLAIGALAVNGIVDGLNKLNTPPINSLSGTKLTVSKSDIDVAQNAVSKATYKAYDSTLLIEAFADKSASTLAGTGSGVLWSADGYVVTCNHVVEGYETIKVTFTDGSSYFAEGIANDPITDLAVLKITLAEGSEVLPVTARDTSKNELMLGETVIAIGNPLGYLTNTVTDGILSSLEREITVEGTTMMLMQISAAVNSGNSGGGLFDINGSLIGIVNAKIAGDDVEGIGFAIPIDTVIDVVTQLADKGYVSGRPQIGVNLVTVTTYNYQSVFKEYPDLQEYATGGRGMWGQTQIIPGVYVVSTSESIKYDQDSDTKLKFGDRIYTIATDDDNFVQVEDSSSIQNFLVSLKVGDTLHITVMRGGKAVTASVILGEKTNS